MITLGDTGKNIGGARGIQEKRPDYDEDEEESERLDDEENVNNSED